MRGKSEYVDSDNQFLKQRLMANTNTDYICCLHLNTPIALKNDVVLEALVVLILDKFSYCGIESARVVEDRICSRGTNVGASPGQNETTMTEATKCVS